MGIENHRIKIIYLGGCWPTNIGNAFIDLGSLYSLKIACQRASIIFNSEMPQWFINSYQRPLRNVINIASLIRSDYIVASGMMLCKEFVKLYEPIVFSAIKKGAKFIINGGGGETYTEEERKIVRDFLKRNPAYAFISRDELSFNYYKDLAKHSFNGIDCGFFISDYFSSIYGSIKLEGISDFVIFNFDNFSIKYKKIINHIKKTNSFLLNNCEIVNISHSCWPSRNLIRNILNFLFRDKYLYRNFIFVSDIPEDYLFLYANTKATFTDRVHAGVVTFSFGKPVMFVSKTKRALLFERVGLKNIQKELVFPDLEKIQNEKKAQLQFLSSILK